MMRLLYSLQSACLIALPLTLALAATSRGGETLWIEAEAPTKHNFVKHGWYDDVKKDSFSGGQWLSHYAPQPAEANYKLTAAEDAEYTLWVRCNNIQVTQHYALDGGAWVACDLKTEPREEMMVSAKPDHRNMAWHKLGKVKLTKGDHALAFRLTSTLQNHGGIDCFLLTSAGFVPSGAKKPGGDAVAGAAGGDLPADTIWIEGEAPTKSTFAKHGWYDDVKKDAMSGGNWLSHYGPQPGEATYALKVAQEGDYTLWVRCNNTYVTQHYAVDGGAWTACDLKTEPREEMMISAKPDHRNLAWHKVGKFKLTEGDHTLAFRLTSQLSNHGGIDCFVLTKSAFVPSGAKKPVVAGAVVRGPDTWFEVIPDDEAFSPQSVIDMSRLLHKPAGSLGFIRREGEKLTAGGKPIKFWGCGANMAHDKPHAWQQQWIRYLAKHGINMVRQHTVSEVLGPLKKDPKTGELSFDAKKLDEWDWWCAELKKNGIYMTWSLCYPHIIGRDEGYDLFEDLPVHNGDPNRRSTSGVATIEPKLQESEWRYVQAILLHKNPYTGLRYVDDPALAVVEIRNEDSIFWHAPLNILVEGKTWPKHTARLKERFAAWLKARYKNDEGLRTAWGAGMQAGDSVDNKNMALYPAWQLAGDGPAQRPKAETIRAGDVIRFLAETQRAGYVEREKLLRGIGFKAITVATAWQVGGPASDPANLWSDDAMEMIDRHNYFGGGAGGHGIVEGKVNNDTQLSQPGGGILAVGLYQVEDKPFSITEWTSLPPNQWKAECAPLIAFYGIGLQGWDASYHFLSSRNRMGGGWPNLSSYVTDTPHYMGQFPALAFAIHKGHLQEGSIAAARRLKIDSIFQGIDALGQDFTGGGYDAKALKGNLTTPAAVQAIGRVTTKFGNDLPASEKLDWSKYWNQEAKTVASVTGELRWDYAKRFVTLNTPKTKALVGFAGGATHDLSGVKVALKTPFVSLIFTPLDDKPLEQSAHILITAMAKDKQTGTEYNADGTQLIKAGGPPLLMEPVEAEITLAGKAPTSVRTLDVYGVPTETKVPTSGNTFSIDGRYQAYYYEVRR